MSTFILAFVFFLAMVLAMAVGYLVQKKTISGSCGGLGALGIEKACDCPEPCDRKKARQEKQEARERKLKEWKDNQIL
ncbi:MULTISPECIES: (Na+)-NQR maturation NqrM [Salinimonas]|uniref:(Na+)-NQR maturation NqrM n=2 Tax=Salinimonas TaxID=288793 RepID=A0A5B7YAM9_9ALTE|nr:MULTISPECIES: (Na+)-NQR maturation NqrM [Salinimonas]MBD3586975.1 (Na+)-NQR maturation NqrM [Salinimonas profundi]QCZ92465.1 (Na+)-NQR maturation NqrM [Salinimonas iocasae]